MSTACGRGRSSGQRKKRKDALRNAPTWVCVINKRPRREGAFLRYAILGFNMVIHLLQAELILSESQSLKDKRQILRSLLAHLRSDFNISVSEVGAQDKWQRAEIAAVVVSTDSSFADQVLSQVVNHIESDPRVELGQFTTEPL